MQSPSYVPPLAEPADLLPRVEPTPAVGPSTLSEPPAKLSTSLKRKTMADQIRNTSEQERSNRLKIADAQSKSKMERHVYKETQRRATAMDIKVLHIKNDREDRREKWD